MGFSDSTFLCKMSLGVCIAAFVFDIIGFPSNDWLTVSSTFGTSSAGLFRQCTLGVCSTYDTNLTVSWFAASQAMEIIGFLSGLACLVLTVIFVVLKTGSRMLHTGALITAFAAAGFIIIGCIIFRAMYKDNVLLASFKLGWSFALAIIGGLLYLTVGVVLIVDKLK